MRIRLLVVAISVFVFCLPCLSQSVVVTGKEVTYTRPKPMQDFKKTFTVNRPVVKASTPVLSRRIESTISYEKIIPVNIKEEINEYQWLETADFEVKYNDRGILVVDLFIEGSGAYPSGSTKTVVVDTRTGNRVTPATSFTNLPGLAAMVKRAQRKEIDEAIIEIRKDPDFRDPDPKTLFESSNFRAKDLDWFSVSARGVTFKYDYGFPHVIQALQPTGEFFFTWAQLQPYMRAGSLLSRVAR